MIECPFCYRVFRQPPEKIGARCPKCRMPLYEDPTKRRRNPEKDLGRCEQHPDAVGIAKCGRCGKPICQTCRTRWHEEPVCPQCVNESIVDDEPSPREAQMQAKQAWISAMLMFGGWVLLLLTLVPYSTFHQGQVGVTLKAVTWFFFLGSLLPAIFGLGYGLSAVRLRGAFTKLAAIGFIGAGSQVGLILAIMIINIWHN
jgi:hypothetical protein